MALSIRLLLQDLRSSGRSAELVWVKGHEGTPGNGKVAGRAAERMGYFRVTSIAHLKLKISERFNTRKAAWHACPAHHGTREVPPPPPKKSCLDKLRNSLARAVAQIRTDH